MSSPNRGEVWGVESKRVTEGFVGSSQVWKAGLLSAGDLSSQNRKES